MTQSTDTPRPDPLVALREALDAGDALNAVGGSRNAQALDPENPGPPFRRRWFEASRHWFSVSTRLRAALDSIEEVSREEPDPKAYEAAVEKMADAIHETCRLEWQAIAAVDPERQVTQHMADAHYGKAHDLVRRYGLPAAASPSREGAGLDVERLARAFFSLNENGVLHIDVDGMKEATDYAQSIAAEYVRLASEEQRETP